MTFMIGQTLSHYHILEQIGAGGMGVLYRARDERLDRDVAVKVLPAGTLSDDPARRRFRQEALALSRLNHPNIETVYDFDTQNGVDFLVTEYVSGLTLANKLDGKALLESEVVALGTQIAAALEEAHDQGIVHRDIKPANIMVTSKGQAKLLDFGLAESLRPVSDLTTTQAWIGDIGVTGTLPYMAPEQLRGEPMDSRSDIYSSGALLYEMATGQRPFPGTHAPLLINAIFHELPPDPVALNPNLSPELNSIILKALDKNPARRYQTAKELREELESLSAPLTVPRARSAFAYRWRILTAATVVALLAVLGVLNVGGWRERLLDTLRLAETRSARKSLGVMYFDNISQDPSLAWLERGVTEMLTTNLAQMQNLEVLSTQRLFDILRLLGKEGTERIDRGTATQVARKARVDSVVTGSIVRAGDKIRLNVVLGEVKSGRVLFSDKVDGNSVQEIFHMVDELTLKIAQSYGVTPLSGEKVAGIAEVTTNSVEAFKLYQQGVENAANLNLTDAIRNFDAATAIDPQFALAYMRSSFTRWMNGDTRGSKEAVAKAVEHVAHAGSKEKLLIRGAAAYLKGEWKAAIELLEQLIAAYPNDKDPYIWLGWSYDSSSQLDKAIATLKRAIRIDPGFAQAFNELGYRYIHKGEYLNAVESFKKYVELRPQEANARDSLGDAFTRLGRYDDALVEYKAALELKPDLAGFWEYLKIGIIYQRKGDLAQARDYVQKYLAVTKDASKPSGYSVLAQMAIGEGNSTSARSYWEQALIAAERSQADWAIAGTLVAFSDYDLFFKRRREGLQLAEMARARFREFRGSALIHIQLAEALLQNGKYEQAQSIIEEFLTRHPDTVTPAVADLMRARIGGLIAYAQGDFPQALNFWLQKQGEGQRKREGAPPLYALAHAYFRSGQWLEAERAYVEAFASRQLNLEHPFNVYYYPEQEFVLALYYLGRIKEVTKRHSEAIGYYREFLSYWGKADFRLPEISDAKTRLSQLTKSGKPPR